MEVEQNGSMENAYIQDADQRHQMKQRLIESILTKIVQLARRTGINISVTIVDPEASEPRTYSARGNFELAFP